MNVTRLQLMQNPNIKRVLLKISGEVLMGDQHFGIDPQMLDYVAEEIISIKKQGMDVAVVVGGGNIFRGVSPQGSSFPRTTGDTMGMLATLMNSLALATRINDKNIKSIAMSAFSVGSLIPAFSVESALEKLQNNYILIFGGGTSNPYFTTDTAAVLRALQIQADVLVKATKVDGIYDSDPAKNPDASFIAKISYDEVLIQNLRVMDASAIAMARDNNLPLMVANLLQKGAIKSVLDGKSGSLVIP